MFLLLWIIKMLGTGQLESLINSVWTLPCCLLCPEQKNSQSDHLCQAPATLSTIGWRRKPYKTQLIAQVPEGEVSVRAIPIFTSLFCCKPWGALVNFVTVSTESRRSSLQRPWQSPFLTTRADHSGIQSRSAGRHASALPPLVSKH